MSNGTNTAPIAAFSLRERNKTTDGTIESTSPSGATSGSAPPSSSAALPSLILENWANIVRASVTTRLLNNLIRLAARSDGWRGPRSLALREKSLKQFLEFWRRVAAQAADPELSLASDGNLSAEWFRTNKNRLDVRFLDEIILFGLFDDKEILEGVNELDPVAELLLTHPSEPLKWRAR